MRRGVSSRTPEVTPSVKTLGVRFWWLLLGALSVLLVLALYRLYFGSSSFSKIEQLEAQLAAQLEYNQQIAEANRDLTIEIEALKNGNHEIETRARESLGLVKPDETFYLFVEE